MRARRENSGERRMIVEETVVELLSGFTTDERAYFADQMEDRLESWRRRR